jgi:hypothetical protein
VEKAGMCHVPPTVQQLEIARSNGEPMLSCKLLELLEN